ncbi:hypothetical protein FQN57_007116 [Myotisia sp. PD_48]|nr:hypothetical protein FQN57_007116 [Myotisia sp. PD_48]
MASTTQDTIAMADQAADQEASYVRDMKGFYKQLDVLSSSPPVESIRAILQDNTKLQNQLKSQGDENASLKKEIEDREKANDNALNVLMETHQREKDLHGKTKQQVKEHKDSIQKMEASLAQQKQGQEELTRKFEELNSLHTQEKKNLSQARKENKSLEQELKSRDSKIEKMKTVEVAVKQKVVTLGGRIKELQAEKDALNTSLNDQKKRLSQLDSFTIPYHEEDEDALLGRFSNIWTYATEEIFPYFEEDIPDLNLNNPQAWKNFGASDGNLAPLPHSNSKAAKQMRFVSLLAVLAREIDTHLFQPTYMTEDGSIRDRLLALARTDSERESYSRLTLLSIDTNNVTKELEERVQIVTRNVGARVHDLFPVERYTNLRSSIANIARRAAETWSTFQRVKGKYEPDFDPIQWGGGYWAPFAFPPDKPAGPDQVLTNRGPLIVFPQICYVDNGDLIPRTYPIGVDRSLPQWIAAEQEMISPVARVGSHRRRLSLAPTSPTSIQNGTFLGQKSVPAN